MATTGSTKSVLLDCAEQAARSRGFDGFSYADLATAVGIRKASIHHHFPTKALLTAALMDRYHARFVARCEEIERANESSASRLLGLINLYRDALNDGQCLCLCVSLTGSRESLSPEVVAKLVHFRAMVIGWLEPVFIDAKEDESIEGASNPSDEARSVLALLEGAHLAARAEEDASIFDRAVQTVRNRCK